MAQLAHQFDLTRLNAFMAVAEEGSITAAALRLGIAQPALSASIRRLEADLATELFQRLPRGVTLTDAGKRLLPYVYETFGILARARNELDHHAKTPRGEVSIGTPPSAATIMLQPLLHQLTEKFPEVSIRMVEAMSGYLYEWVELGELDIAITFNNVDTQTILSLPLFQEEVVLIGVPADMSGLPEPFPVARLHELPLILTSGRHKLRSILEQQTMAMGQRLNIRYEIDSGHELVRLVSSGAGFGVFARSAFADEIAHGRVETRTLQPNYSRMVCLNWHRRKKADLLVSMVVEAVKTCCHDLRASGKWPD